MTLTTIKSEGRETLNHFLSGEYGFGMQGEPEAANVCTQEAFAWLDKLIERVAEEQRTFSYQAGVEAGEKKVLSAVKNPELRRLLTEAMNTSLTKQSDV